MPEGATVLKRTACRAAAPRLNDAKKVSSQQAEGHRSKRRPTSGIKLTEVTGRSLNLTARRAEAEAQPGKMVAARSQSRLTRGQ
jgi:hypothetical protein